MLPWRLTSPLTFLLVLLTFWTESYAIKWLALYNSKQKPWNHNQNCSKSLGLVKRQIKICKQNLDLMGTVSHAAYLTVDTCQGQFTDRRWNCSSIRNAPRISRELVRGTREQAYVYAISSAALVHSIARACSVGVTTKCSCGALPNHPPMGDFKWGGCGDDVKFGLYLSEMLTDATLQKKGKVKNSKKAQMNRHNNAAGRNIPGYKSLRCPGYWYKSGTKWTNTDLLKSRGGIRCHGGVSTPCRPVTPAVSPQSNSNEIREKRILVIIGTDVSTTAIEQIVAESLTIACKCHGVSGSCSIKTCWRSLPDFSVVGTTLKNLYASAVEVKRRKRKNIKIYVPINPKIQTVTDTSLIYYTKSPDYCSPDSKTGSIGTFGRFCDKDSSGWGGCDTMCCGRGFKSFIKEIVERCECKYYWCCYVKCKTCKKKLNLNTCR